MEAFAFLLVVFFGAFWFLIKGGKNEIKDLFN
jgi:hypothetical protein